MAEFDTKNQLVDSSSDIPLPKKRGRKPKPRPQKTSLLIEPVHNPLWLSISEAAKLGGITTKTLRRAIQGKIIKYKIQGNRYLIDAASFIIFLHTTKKLTNKLNQTGIGQYIEKWKE